MRMDKALPNDWKLLKVEDLYQVIGGGTPSTTIPEYWNGNIPWITSADIHGLEDIRPRKKISEYGLTNSATSLVPANSLIVVTRVSLGKVALTNTPLCFSQDSQALIAKDGRVLPKFALYYLSQAAQVFIYQSRGTTISGVTKKQLKELAFPLPPLPEQERIVAKIEELFTQLDAGTAALRRIQAGLKRYKASLLKAACEGRLVEQDPNDEPAEELLRRLGKKPLEGEDLPELPRGWCWVNWDQLVSLSQNGFGKRNSEKGTPTIVLRLADIEDNKTNLAKSRRIKASLEEVEKYRLQNNDILCIRVNGSLENVGRMIIIRDYDESILFCDHFIRFRLVLPELSPFITFYFQADRARKYVELNRVSSAGQNTISQSTLFNFSVPLPPLEEQHRIVNEIERLLSVEAKIEEVVKANIERSSRLRQAILKRAFEGRLV